MASGEVIVEVACEKVVHDAMRKIWQTIWDTYGISIDEVKFEHDDISTHDKSDCFAGLIHISTTTPPKKDDQ